MLRLFESEGRARSGVIRPINWPALQPGRIPQFLVKQDPVSSSRWESLKTIFARVKPPGLRNSSRLFRHVTLQRSKTSGHPFSTSVVIHACFILLLVYLHQAMPRESLAAPASPFSEKIYYRVPLVQQAKLLPRVAPQGSGGRPGGGAVPELKPLLGSSASQMIVIISKPVRPDNSRQTIHQPNTPPDIRIIKEIKLPNMVSVELPKPVFRFKPTETRPQQVQRRLDTQQAPTVNAQNAALLKSIEESSDPQLRVPLLPAVASAPQAREARLGGVQEAPVVEGASNGTGLVVISVDPGGPESPVVLPPGNRSGDFTISAAPGNGGSPAGSPNGAIAGGAGGSRTGSDASTGLGRENAGGGGGKSGAAGTLSIKGGPGEGGGAGTLAPAVALSMVYPVSRHLSVRKSSIIVSAGPVGGGGLDVYDVLHCGKIYTIFLAMPGRNWTMQYCQKGAGASPSPEPRSPSTFVHLDSGLVPPDLDIETRYEFRRLPVPPEKAGKLIVLKGTLAADGTVGGLEIFQGVVPQMDQAARIAFSRWKFKPAMRDGKPVPVEILVGVPTDAAKNVSN